MSEQSKKFIIGIILIALTGGIYWLGFVGGGKKEEKNLSAGEKTKEEIILSESGIGEEKKSPESNEEKIPPAGEEFTEYQNQAYDYSLKFSDRWKMNNDSSEAKLEKKKVSDEFEMEVGGQTFWSNYANINKYNPGNRPADFLLLALTVYRDAEKNITLEKFAEKLGFAKEISEAVSFETENVQGREFVAPGAEKGKPRIAIIFQKEKLFYVFNLAFAENKERVEEMENIVQTFRIIDSAKENPPGGGGKININVPFTSQAPFSVWDEKHEEACEEASLVMVKYYLDGKTLNKEISEKEIQDLIEFQIENYGDYKDTDSADTVKLAEDYYKIKNLRLLYDFKKEDLKKELDKGNPIIVPAAGRLLGNPNFTPPGPLYHNLVLTGYAGDSIITNDPGTRKGEGYQYDINVLYDAIHDFPGKKEDIEKGRKAMIVVEN